MSRRRGPPKLKALTVADSDGATQGLVAGDDSFVAGESKFESGDISVDSRGLRIADVEGDHDRGFRYEDLEEVRELGAGCSSTVKLARHKATGELYALKCIGLYMKAMRDQLMTELRTLFNSDCEGLIDFYGAVYREGSVAVILEYMNLGGLDNITKRTGTIPEVPLAAMTYQMLWGLGYLAHDRRVHRDVKPMNVLVNTNGQVKLTDFGISRELSTAVLAKTFVGSFKYMSPERMATEPYSYSSDIWSLGLILFECATARSPFPESESHIEYVTTVMDSEVPELDDSFSSEFRDFIDQCLKKNPDERSSALTLLDSPWLELHGIDSLDEAVRITRDWLTAEGFEAPAKDRAMK